MSPLLYFLFFLVYITYAVRSPISITNLSIDEESALFNARKMSLLQSLFPFQKPLLCATFMSLRSEKSFKNLVQNIKYAKERCEWLVVSYNAVNETLYSSRVAIIEEVGRSANTIASIMRHSFGNSDGLMKPLLFDILLPFLQLYSKVWLMDEDISIVGFDFRSYFGIWRCAFNEASPPPVISQPLINGNKNLPPFSKEGWAMYKNSVVAFQSAWIEQQSPILDSKFFSWFIRNFVLPLKSDFIQSRSDFGYDQTWCGAAEIWNHMLRERTPHNDSTGEKEEGEDSMRSVNNPPCVVIIADNYVNHMDFKSIVDWHSKRVEYLVAAFKKKFPNTYYDGFRDSSFYDKQRWYSKSSGTCMHKPFLRTVPDVILETQQIRQEFLSYTFPLMGSRSPTNSPTEVPTIMPVAVATMAPRIGPTPTPTEVPATLQAPISKTIAGPSLTPTLNNKKPTINPSRIAYFATQKPTLASDFLVLSSENLLGNFNTQSRLLVEASVRSSQGCLSNWTVNDIHLNLSVLSVTPLLQYITATKTTTLQLFLTPNALSAGQHYTFSCNCGWLSSSILVQTNAPPSSGFFFVSPRDGYELSTLFNFTAALWKDPDLPLQYQFAYFDAPTNADLALNEESLSSRAVSYLPAGLRSTMYAMNCSLVVYDSLFASTRRIVSVKVNPADSKSVSNFINKQLSSPASVGTLNLISTVLNAVNCTGVFMCGGLNRVGCSTVDFTCGECIDGFTGEAGAHNTLCVKVISSVVRNSSSCRKFSDCPLFQQCNSSTRNCYTPLKQCPNKCSAQGRCQYVNNNNGLVLTTCTVSSSYCSAVCVCNRGFAGSACSMKTAQLLEKQSQRSLMINSFINLHTANISSPTVVARFGTLQSITQKSDEIGYSTIGSALIAANGLLQYAGLLGVDYTQVVSVLKSADSVASAFQDGNYTSLLLSTIRAYNSLVSGQIVSGETVNNILSTYRTVSVGLLKSVTKISVPMSELEALESPGIPNSCVHMSQNKSSTSSAVTVSVVEINSKLVDNAKLYTSNPLSIQISDLHVLLESNVTTGSYDVLTTMQNIVPYAPSARINLTTVCHGGKQQPQQIVKFKCPQSKHTLVHNCSNKVGIMRSYCPVYQPSCKVLAIDEFNNRNVSCHAVSYSTASTTCLCSIAVSKTQQRRALTTSTQSAADNSGVFQLATVSVLVSSEFANTFTAAPDVTSPDSLADATIVIAMFFTMWAFVGILTCSFNWYNTWQQNKGLEEKVKISPSGGSGEHGDHRCKSSRDYVVDYIRQAFPSAFHHKLRLHHIVEELRNHHRYLLLLTPSPPGRSNKARNLIAANVLTSNSLLMFLMVLFYDVHSPADDGSCPQLQTEAACVTRRSPLVPDQSYCVWNGESSSALGSCVYNPSDLTVQTILVVVVLVSVATAVLVQPIGYLFTILEAPTVDSKKLQVFRASIRADNDFSKRRASKLTTTVEENDEIDLDHLFKQIVGVETIVIPSALSSAHLRAKRSIADLLSLTGLLPTLPIPSNNATSPRSQQHFNEDTSQPDFIFQRRTSDIHSELLAKVLSHRRIISTGMLPESGDLEEFDLLWGINSVTSRFVRRRRFRYYCCGPVESGTEAVIAREIVKVKRQCELIVDKLRLATDTHAGLEILHLFVLDLLGRDSPAGKIFESRSAEDFKRICVVSYSAQCMAAGVLFLLNFFFAYYTVLYGYRHGMVWQRNYLVACLVQLVVEVFINETLEVLWVNIIAPLLVQTEVHSAIRDVIRLVNQVFIRAEQSKSPTSNVLPSQAPELNVPDYLFVSTNVAKAFPVYFESRIVHSFTTHLPGDVSRKWRDAQTSRGVSNAVGRLDSGGWCLRWSLLFVETLTVLQYVGAMPLVLQRAAARSGQPLFVSLVLLIYNALLSEPAFAVLLGLVPMCIVGILVYDYRRTSASKAAIAPLKGVCIYVCSIKWLRNQFNNTSTT